MVIGTEEPRSLREESRNGSPTQRVSTSLDTNRIWKALEEVPDPEIPAVSLIDLGIIRDVSPDRVVLTPTYTGCPATFVIETMVRAALDQAGFEHVRIETTLSPPWTTDWITKEGRDKLRAYGIAPPIAAGTRDVQCPQCSSANTEELSRFGSTPCKAQWRCRDCLEPFDLFKCH
jgi:ring-1,2-phenylacetyl-CoA epoxidase subunit PaaD